MANAFNFDMNTAQGASYLVKLSEAADLEMENPVRVRSQLSELFGRSWAAISAEELEDIYLRYLDLGVEIEDIDPAYVRSLESALRSRMRATGREEDASDLGFATTTAIGQVAGEEQAREITSLAFEGGGMQTFQAALNTNEDYLQNLAILDETPREQRQQRIAELMGQPDALAGWQQPAYSATRGVGAEGLRAFTRKSGTKQLIGARGFGRVVNEKLKGDLRLLVVSYLTRHYKEMQIGQGHSESTGTLLRSIEEGTIDVVEGEATVGFTFTIADLKRDARKDDHGGARNPGRVQSSPSTAPEHYSIQPSTHFYGPLVFQGRRPIVSLKKMIFRSTISKAWVGTHAVKAAPARDIFGMSDTETQNIAATIASRTAARILATLIGQEQEGAAA